MLKHEMMTTALGKVKRSGFHHFLTSARRENTAASAPVPLHFVNGYDLLFSNSHYGPVNALTRHPFPAHNENCCLLLLDLSLPDSAGRETFLRARAAAPVLPIGVRTGAAGEAIGLEAVPAACSRPGPASRMMSGFRGARPLGFSPMPIQQYPDRKKGPGGPTMSSSL
jgi:hypothetical protein